MISDRLRIRLVPTVNTPHKQRAVCLYLNSACQLARRACVCTLLRGPRDKLITYFESIKELSGNRDCKPCDRDPGSGSTVRWSGIGLCQDLGSCLFFSFPVSLLFFSFLFFLVFFLVFSSFLLFSARLAPQAFASPSRSWKENDYYAN